MSEQIPNSYNVQDITDALYQCYGLDFRGYADASFGRRIEHVIKIFGLESSEELINKIKNEPDFKLSLIHEITVGATEMFRDPAFWLALKKDILRIFKSKESLDIWVAGCSTGEEVFTLAIILDELGLAEKANIIASDLDLMKIDVARKGYYFRNSFEKNCENYSNSEGIKSLDHYCEKDSSGYQMNLHLLRNVNFIQQDLLQKTLDQTFDVVLCRNVMIYFNLDVQNSFLRKIKRNINPAGFLGLGLEESITLLDEASHFKVFKRIEKIYQLHSNGEED